MAAHCQFWLPRKNRYCANRPLCDSSFCGNHTKRSDEKWILCPIDPSHSVLEENLKSHLKRCPFLKQAQSLSSQPYYQKGINAGTADQEEEAADMNSKRKRKAVYAKSVPEFFELIRKIKSIHASICSDIRDSLKNPEACAAWTNRQIDRKLPFQEKHVLQQASILGNLEDFGVLRRSEVDNNSTIQSDASTDDNDADAVVEFGAGRGYLTQMLTDCYGIKKVLLVERRSYKLKADRSLRQIESLKLERLRIDIEDLNLKDVEFLQGAAYIAIGKHLCGSATDMALRCCVEEQLMQDCVSWTNTSFFLKGLAIATCCHHLCQWKHYINKKYMSELGLTVEDFQAITWFTSWAVDADHRLDLSGSDRSQHSELSENEDVRSESSECEVGEVMRNMKAAERAVLGFMCKDIIDVGRITWLQEQGLPARIVKYVPPSISPENHLLMAKKEDHS